MKAYTIIDKNERNAQSECVLYTFKEFLEQLQRMNEYLYSDGLKEELLNN